MNTDKEVKERGAAEINITLEGGVITVRHGVDSTVLAQWVGRGNDWEEIWKTIDYLSCQRFPDSLGGTLLPRSKEK